jgi:hypothetical protein
MRYFEWMLYVAVTPDWAYALLIVLSAWFLTHRWRKVSKPKTIILSVIYFGSLTQVLSSFVPLFLTLQDSISTIACMTGIWGHVFNMALILVSLILFLYGSITSNQGFWAEAKRWKYFMLAAILAQILASIIYLRSALLCTV